MKGGRYPVHWPSRRRLNQDASLTRRPTAGLGQNDETGGLAPG